METLLFKSDASLRKRLFVPESFQHPAKGHLGCWQECILRYSKVGDTVLDPMSGMGSTLLTALMGRNVVCVELEEWMMPLLRANWEKMRQHPMLEYPLGEAQIFQGDSRDLSWLWPVDCVITSPPYEGSVEETRVGTSRGIRTRFFGTETSAGRQGYGDGYTRPVDVVITSPPFGGEEQHTGGESTTWAEHYTNQKGNKGYTRPVDAIVTSPSYEGTNIGRAESLGEAPFGGPNSQARGIAYAPNNAENVGNLRGQAYWDSMSRIYAECWRCLKPGGLMALVLKGFTQDGKYVDLPGQTEALLLEAGWLKHDHWRRELWSLSFWRILQATDKEETVVAHRQDLFDLDISEVKTMKRVQNGKLDDRLRYEEVLAFRKPEGEGEGSVQAVITSPPYEGVAQRDRASEPYDAKRPPGFRSLGANRHVSSYTRPSLILTSPPYEGSLQGDAPSGKLFETERRVNSPASGNRKSLRKPLGQGYSKLQARAERVAKAAPGKRNVFQEALDNPGAVSRRGFGEGYTRKEEAG